MGIQVCTISTKPEELPKSLAWVPLYVAFVNNTLGDLVGWDILRNNTQPLECVLHLRFSFSLQQKALTALRESLVVWCERNNTHYQKYEGSGCDFKALLYMRGLGPEQKNYPAGY